MRYGAFLRLFASFGVFRIGLPSRTAPSDNAVIGRQHGHDAAQESKGCKQAGIREIPFVLGPHLNIVGKRRDARPRKRAPGPVKVGLVVVTAATATALLAVMLGE